MFMNRKVHKLFSVFVVITLVLLISVTPLMAATSVKIAPYKELEDSHLYTDELAYFSSYLVNRAIMFYELAVLTGDLSYLQEIKPLFDLTNSYLHIVKGTVNCSATLIGVIDDIAKYFTDSSKIIDSMLASTKPQTVYDTTKINALIAEIDSLNDIVISTINPALAPSQIDIMSVGNMAVTLRLKEQMLMRAVYTYALPSTRRLSSLDKVIEDSEYYLEFFTMQAEKSISKVTVIDQKTKRQLILNTTTDVAAKSDELLEKIAGFSFPSTPVLNLNNTFVRNMETIDSLINNEVLGAVFT